MTTATASRPAVRAFVAYRLVSRGYFHLSVLFVFILQSGHGVIAVASALAAYGLAMAALTPATPALVARLGEGRALVIGELLKAVGLVMLALAAFSLPLVVVAQVVNALGFALAASADPKLVGRLVDPTTARSLQASTQSLMFLMVLVSGVAGGALYLVDSRLPILAGGAAALVASLLAASVARAAPPSAATPTPARNESTASTADPGGEPKRVAPGEIRWLTYYILTRGFMLGTFIGLLPFLIFVVLQANVLALSAYLGAYSLAAFLTARYVGRLIGWMGPAGFAAASGVVLLASLLVFALSTSPVLVVLALVLLGAAAGGVRPATMNELGAISQRFRGTPPPGWLLSRMEGIFGVCNALVVLLGGIMIAQWSFTAAMLASCVVYVVFQAVAELYSRRRTAVENRIGEPAPGVSH